MITVEHVHKTYDVNGSSISALRDINLHIPKSEVFGIIGRSGAGKSTLIRTFNLLERPTQGSIRIDGEDITRLDGDGLRQLRQRIGMVFQNFNLMYAKTVAANIDYPMKLSGRYTRQQRAERIDELLDLVGLSAHRDKYPAQLSGGQKQRVGIARAIANHPQLLLCDEATSALDPETTLTILDLLADINRRLGLTIVLITHEMQVVRRICDRVAVIDAGEIVESGSVAEVFLHPRHAVTKSLVAGSTAPDAELGERPAGSMRVRLTYVGDITHQPLLTEIAAHTSARIAILQGTVSRIKDMPYGQMLIEIHDAANCAEQVFALFRELGLRYDILE